MLSFLFIFLLFILVTLFLFCSFKFVFAFVVIWDCYVCDFAQAINGQTQFWEKFLMKLYYCYTILITVDQRFNNMASQFHMWFNIFKLYIFYIYRNIDVKYKHEFSAHRKTLIKVSTSHTQQKSMKGINCNCKLKAMTIGIMMYYRKACQWNVFFILYTTAVSKYSFNLFSWMCS